MQIHVMLVPAGVLIPIQVAHIPRVGDCLDLMDLSNGVATELRYVAQVIHTIGDEPESHRVILKLILMSQKPGDPHAACENCPRAVPND